MERILDFTLNIALVIHILLIIVAVWRVWRGENIVDRLIGADLVSTLTMAVIILAALILRSSIYLDVVLGLAALGFISIFVYAKYAADERVF
jgi:multisubunit Na+/H+ antiporter MnhF subunit